MRKLTRFFLHWGKSIAAATSLGYLGELLLNDRARTEALDLQARMMAAIDSFTPLLIFRGIADGFSQTSWPDTDVSGPLRLTVQLLQYLFSSGYHAFEAVARNAPWMRVPMIVVGSLSLLSAAGGAFFAWQGRRSKNVRAGNTRPSLNPTILEGMQRQSEFQAALVTPVLFALMLFASSLAFISLSLFALQCAAFAAVLAFHWITELAQLCAVIGSVSSILYFAVVKTLESKAHEAVGRESDPVETGKPDEPAPV